VEDRQLAQPRVELERGQQRPAEREPRPERRLGVRGHPEDVDGRHALERLAHAFRGGLGIDVGQPRHRRAA
jgi:hypothetical protein